MRDFHLLIIDDESGVIGDLHSRLMITLEDLEPNFKFFTFLTLEAAREHLTRSDALTLLILDHDFPVAESELISGYDLSSWVKNHFWTRHFTPIIYYTGRESRHAFDAQKLSLGSSAPDFYYPKSDSYSSRLEELLEAVHTRMCNFEDTMEQHGLEVAMIQFTSLGWDQ